MLIELVAYLLIVQGGSKRTVIILRQTANQKF